MQLADRLRSAAFWVDAMEATIRNHDEPARGMYRALEQKRADLIALVAEREDVSVEAAARLLAGDYLYRQLCRYLRNFNDNGVKR